MPYAIALACLSLLFFLIQSEATRTGIFLTDSTIYWCHGGMLAQGAAIYKDFFHANMPLTPVFAWLYRSLTSGSLPAFFATGALEALGCSIFLYLIALHVYKKPWIALLTAFAFLTSAVVLSTSRFQTFMYTGLLFILGGYYTYLHGKITLSAALLAIGVAIKLYFAPVATALAMVVWFTRRKDFARFALAGALIFAAVTLPFILRAPQEFLHQVLLLSSLRPEGNNKLLLIWEFIRANPHLPLLAGIGIMQIRKTPWLGGALIGTVSFYLLFRDLYYLYFTMLVPFALLAIGQLVGLLERALPASAPRVAVLGAVFAGLTVMNGVTYADYVQRAVIRDEVAVRDVMEREQPAAVYGMSGIMQSVSAKTGIPLFQNICDTNRNIFRWGLLDMEKNTAAILRSRVMVVLLGTDRNGTERIYGEDFVNLNAIHTRCKRVHREPILWQDKNVVFFYQCGKST